MFIRKYSSISITITFSVFKLICKITIRNIHSSSLMYSIRYVGFPIICTYNYSLQHPKENHVGVFCVSELAVLLKDCETEVDASLQFLFRVAFVV